MAFIRVKTIKGKEYYYLVESVREGGKVRQKIVQYFGTTLPDVYSVIKRGIVSTKATNTPISITPVKGVVLIGAVVPKGAVKKVGTTKTKGKVEPSVAPKTVVPTGKDRIYCLVSTVHKKVGFPKHRLVKNFGTTLPNDSDIALAIGAKDRPGVSGYYLTESRRYGKGFRTKIIKSGIRGDLWKG